MICWCSVFFFSVSKWPRILYHVLYCSLRKTVTVMFRGTTTLKDVLVDADGFIVDCDNPLNPESKEKIGLHHGFLGEWQLFAVWMNYKVCPGYRLYVTGHSLGASLAQLFAMEAAASHECIPKPVTVINFASPKVGNIFFRNCFEVWLV